MAADDDLRLRRFAAGLAHELNNALTAVIGISELVAASDQLPSTLAPQMQLVVEHAQRIGSLAQRLAEFSRGTEADATAALEAALGKPLPQITAGETRAAAAPGRTGDAVLLVDDEEVVRTVVAWQLEGMGYRVLAAPTAEEALTLHAREPGRIAAALLDMILPGINGLELCRRLRQDDPGLPVIMLSGLQRDASTSEDVLWLVKPVALGDLQQALTSVLARG